ncbi:MAG: hypothetical protein Q8L90_03150 [Bacteroidota bacterium]|nr:hypothetical protein [Bacteroidota bacterium]
MSLSPNTQSHCFSLAPTGGQLLLLLYTKKSNDINLELEKMTSEPFSDELKSYLEKSKGYPPIFSKTFREGEANWDEMKDVNFEMIGKILVCHLIVEHYISKVIEFITPKEFDWDDSRLTYNQKISLIRKVTFLHHRGNIVRGLKLINAIRNQYSHNLNATIKREDIEELRNFINSFNDLKGERQMPKNVTDINVIEIFTQSLCTFLAGCCTELVAHEKKK